MPIVTGIGYARIERRLRAPTLAAIGMLGGGADPTAANRLDAEAPAAARSVLDESGGSRTPHAARLSAPQLD